jgi:Complex 1 protein (LYR family)
MSRQVLHLYRAILKNGRHYPSRNRNEIINEARELFREHKVLTDQDKIRKELENARVGLNELLMYAPKQMKSDGHDSEWSVTLRGGTLPDSQSTDFLKGK